MQVIGSRFFSWLGETLAVANINSDLKFYSHCKLDKSQFEIGGGVTLIYKNKLHVGCVQYLYENTSKTSPIDKFQVVVELFYMPKDLYGLLTNPIDLDADIEIIKQGKPDLKHLPIDCLKSPCLIAYGLADEEPCDLMQEFAETTRNAIYVCRYLAFAKNGQFTLKETVVNEIEISDDESNGLAVIQVPCEIIEIEDDDNSNSHSVTRSGKSSAIRTYYNRNKNTSGSPNITSTENSQNVANTAISSPPTTPVINRKYAITVPEGEAGLKLRFVRKKRRRKGVSASDFEVYTVTNKSDSFNSDVSVTTNQSDISPTALLTNLTITDGIQSGSQISPSSLINSISLNDNATVEPNIATVSSETSAAMRSTPRKTINKRRITFLDDAGKENLNQNGQAMPVVVLEKIAENEQRTEESSAEMDNRPRLRLSTRRASQKRVEESITPLRKSVRLTRRKSYVEDDVSPESSPLRRSIRQKNMKNDDDYGTEKSDPVKPPKLRKDDDGAVKRATSKLRKEQSPPTPVTPAKEDIVRSVRGQTKRTSAVTEEPTIPTPKKQSKVVSTPKSTRILVKNMTPAINERDEMMETCGTPMQRARAGLSFCNVPSRTPCRELEYTNIYRFVSGRLRDQTSGCMYISGVPGTGKTMTVFKVMKDLAEEYDDFVFLKLNALSLTEPRQIYVQIIKKLQNKILHWEQALSEIERFFKAKAKKIAHVLLIDELDKLCNRKQDVIYNLLDLPFHSATPLIVITIANTMDLPERILTNKVNSRLGLVRLTFKPYQYKDLVKIVTERLSNEKVFKGEALELVARKVAAVSGDARRALSICSRATEVAEEEDQELVSMEIVDRVVNEMISSSKVKAVKCCSRMQKLILSSLSSEVTRTGNEEVPFINLINSLEKLCYLESVEVPSVSQCLRLCHHLGSFRLLIIQHGRMDLNMTLMLNISPDDIHFALR